MAQLKRSKLFSFLAFVLVFGTGVYYTYLTTISDRQEQKILLEEIVSAQAAAIERRLTRSLSSTYILAQEVRRSKGDFKDFEKFAGDVIDTLGGVSNLQLAPSGIIEKIHPLAGNEKAIGHNLLRDDARREEAHLAINTKMLTLAGPFELVQGGEAVIGRNPVFLEKDGEEYFWGFTSALIFLDDLLAVTELDQLEAKGYTFELVRKHPDTGEMEVFAESAGHEHNNPVIKSVKVPNGEWSICISRPSVFPYLALVDITVSFIFACLFAFLVRRVMREPDRLRALVKQQTQQLEVLAFKDELTGLANRRFLIEQLEQSLLTVKRNGKYLALIYLDLDDFKRVNDSMGHEMGDKLLIEVASRIRESVRKSDIVGRLGGDEFAVVLLDMNSPDNARAVAGKIIENIKKPIQLGSHQVVVGATMGITLAPDDGQSGVELFRNADLAMYASKRAGKNQFSFFNVELQRQAEKTLSLEEELREALINKEFRLVFQPIISFKSGQAEKFEALLRWDHPVKREQSPGAFIDVAEMTGMIVPIGYWVVEAALEFIQRQIDSGQTVKPVAINVSARQLRDELFAKHIEELLRSHDIEPGLIELEITESLLIEDVALAIKLINQLRKLGISISIDDFGTGYSSLSQLKQFPVNTLKIDRSFVKDLEDGVGGRQFVEAITVMVHKLDIEVVAEGIETQSQLSFLKKIGCDYGQGFLLARPLTADAALAFSGSEELPGQAEVANV